MTTPSVSLGPERPTLQWPAVTVLLHGICVIALTAGVRFMVPPYKGIFRDFKMRLPWITEAVIRISDWFRIYWYILPFVIVAVLALDGGVVFLLGQAGRRKLRIAWLVLPIPLAVLLGLLVVVSLVLPLHQLVEALSQ